LKVCCSIPGRHQAWLTRVGWHLHRRRERWRTRPWLLTIS
jgi:hypothetical protein